MSDVRKGAGVVLEPPVLGVGGPTVRVCPNPATRGMVTVGQEGDDQFEELEPEQPEEPDYE